MPVGVFDSIGGNVPVGVFDSIGGNVPVGLVDSIVGGNVPVGLVVVNCGVGSGSVGTGIPILRLVMTFEYDLLGGLKLYPGFSRVISPVQPHGTLMLNCPLESVAVEPVTSVALIDD